MTRFGMMEPDHVNEKTSHYFAVVAADGRVRVGLCGIDDHRQKLLAERGQAKRIRQDCCSAKQREFRIRLRPRIGESATCNWSERHRSRLALSGWPEIPVMSARTQWSLALVARASSAVVYRIGPKRKGLRIYIDLRNPFTFVSTKTE
jgi:hypothetical protein